MNVASSLRLFEGFGVELEYMIVDAKTLSVHPVADELLKAVAGDYVSDVEFGDLAWSNELVCHVIEFKTLEPARSLEGLAGRFNQQVAQANRLLAPLGARLMPTGMHPWMDPNRETRLWPHDCSVIYDAFNRIFGCQGHGWSNLQSLHINLPFADDEEFGRLHAAIRLLLPILPALAAASPILDGRLTGVLDNRLEVYRYNSRRIPSVAGKIIPEQAFTRREYETRILERIYRDIAPHDPEKILQHEWLNARGAIARFDRNSIEIRVLDVQECPLADLAIYAAIVAVLKAVIHEKWVDYARQQDWTEDELEPIFLTSIRDAEQALIRDPRYTEMFGFQSRHGCLAVDLWQHLLESALPGDDFHSGECRKALDVILREGPLARRILRALGGDTSPTQIGDVYAKLCDCLAYGRMFRV